VWLLVDRSASTAAVHLQGGRSVLGTATRCAHAMASALQSIGVACAVSGFSSQGRHAVHLETLKAFDEEGGEQLGARLQALRPGGSTRLGAVLRHAARRLAGHGGAPLWVIVLSDGEAHDIDVHDPRYLVEDARHAVGSMRRSGMHAACIVLEAQRGTDARRIFGSQGVQSLRDLSQLPRVMQRLLA
jgi:nitric oxide reductase activation protein